MTEGIIDQVFAKYAKLIFSQWDSESLSSIRDLKQELKKAIIKEFTRKDCNSMCKYHFINIIGEKKE